MKFSDFHSFEQVLAKYPLNVQQDEFLPEVKSELPALFLENLRFSLKMKTVGEGEVFFRENFIFPFLQQAWKRHQRLKLWANKPLALDGELAGEPDYLISARIEGVVNKLINTPLLAVAEAKKDDFEKGWAQCLVEMIACQKLNQNEKVIIYGIVSTGLVWEFGKLAGNVFTKHPLAYSISEPEKVLGLIDYVFAECEKQLS